MDDRESPTNDLQVNVQDLLHANTQCLASSPDENENQLNGSKHKALKSRDKVMGIVEQDSINNNEGQDSGVCASHCQEALSDQLTRSSGTDEMLIPEICFPENKSSRKTKSCIKKVAKQKKKDAEDGNKSNANCSQKDPTQTLQALFSLLREEFEEMDSRVLPLCLHQIAETYFQDGEYEKAMKFIQLEQLYHEQLLANLSSIQQQWEKKWKAAAAGECRSLKKSAKDLNNEELDKLAELCTSHQEPLVSRSKLINEENTWTHNSFIGLIGSEDLKERGAASCDSDENVKSERNVLHSNHCHGSSVISSGQLGSSILNHQQRQPVYKNDRTVPCRTSSDISENVCSRSNMPEQATVGYAKVSEGIQETTELEEEDESEGSEDFFEQFLNGCIKVREESLKYLGTPGSSDTLSHIPNEQALYCSSEGYSLEESFSSLDELAKRIKIAETAPAEGLVSILKKRDDSEGKTLSQIQQRQSKRRVRFQEMDDTLDQEEVGGGSCILLILLCIATVFLSVGGTALYCTFGDTESPVCTDFAANVDFYCTRIIQGIEELKHWISFS
ncbi:consortin isoform X2 [Eublepharis macularius]|uniref:Consortin isoform X2 n=1 Tax=Eublepharis macularius TaxID=481883 RepID=A0AA97J647_EUBMA|nr:consortin isoform X2 [Eublepharis macularius]